MAGTSSRSTWLAGCAGLLCLGMAHAQEPAASADLRHNVIQQGERLDAMRSQLAAQMAQIEQLKRALAEQEADYRALRHAMGMDGQPPGSASTTSTPGVSPPGAAATDTTVAATQPVGRAPVREPGPPAVAPIFEQPGVLTPRGKFVIEPSYQFGYSSADRVDLIGYTVIPAVLIGLIDARQVRTTTQTGALALRYGLSNRMELELRVPYLHNHTDTTSREIFTGSAQDRVFTSSGHGLGDIEATARYQMNDGGADKPYFVGWLRFKSRTGRDPFDVTTDCVNRCIQNVTGTGMPLQLPTGSGFYALQPGVTWLYPSDPVVFFGNLSYLHNFPRHGVSRRLLGGEREALGTIDVGDVVDLSLGMGFALNDKASISLGYDQSFVGLTRQNGKTVAGSAKIVLGTLLVGGSYRLSDKRSLNVALGVGVTRDTPDATVTVRVPTTY
ncbi:MAG: acetate kinase [Rhodanobacter sp.]